MECSLGSFRNGGMQHASAVLILILMEYSLGGCDNLIGKTLKCLNPYSNGILTWNQYAAINSGAHPVS